jgi:hypothetical protein
VSGQASIEIGERIFQLIFSGFSVTRTIFLFSLLGF